MSNQVIKIETIKPKTEILGEHKAEIYNINVTSDSGGSHICTKICVPLKKHMIVFSRKEFSPYYLGRESSDINIAISDLPEVANATIKASFDIINQETCGVIRMSNVKMNKCFYPYKTFIKDMKDVINISNDILDSLTKHRRAREDYGCLWDICFKKFNITGAHNIFIYCRDTPVYDNILTALNFEKGLEYTNPNYNDSVDRFIWMRATGKEKESVYEDTFEYPGFDGSDAIGYGYQEYPDSDEYYDDDDDYYE